jgi:hypothetical protein
MEQGAWSREHGARSMEQGAWSKEHGAGSMEQGAWSKKAWSRERGAGAKRKNPGEDETRMRENEKQFRFQDFGIWKRGAETSGKLFPRADELESDRFCRAMRGAALSITNPVK